MVWSSTHAAGVKPLFHLTLGFAGCFHSLPPPIAEAWELFLFRPIWPRAQLARKVTRCTTTTSFFSQEICHYGITLVYWFKLTAHSQAMVMIMLPQGMLTHIMVNRCLHNFISMCKKVVRLTVIWHLKYLQGSMTVNRTYGG